jgi:hypothetical protein
VKIALWYDKDRELRAGFDLSLGERRMNEFSYPTPQAVDTEHAGSLPADQPVGYLQSSDEIAQRILVGMQQGIDAQIDWRLRAAGKPDRAKISGEELSLILGSIGIGVPLTAISGALAGLPAIIVVWIGLVIINVAWAARRGS